MFGLLNNVINESGSPALDRYNSVATIGSALINVLIATVFSISLIGIAYASVQFILSEGDPKRIDKARNSMMWSIVAALIAIASIAIKVAIIQATGVSSTDISGTAPNF
jgi:hypothetical protein